MKKIVAMLFTAVSFSAFANVWTDPDTGITWWYMIKNGGASVGGVPNGTISAPSYMTAVLTTTKGAITIPSTLEGYSVTSIDSSAFRDCSGLTSVRIPSSVASIGYGAFFGCSGLTSIEIPSSVTSINGSTFSGCSGLTSIIIPEGVTSIGNDAFRGCSGLTSVTIPEGVTSIGNDAFYGCSGLTSMTIPSSVMGIGYGAFSGCSGLTSITLPFIGSERGSGAVFGYIFGRSSYFGAVAVTQDDCVTYYIPASLKTVIVTDETKIGYGAFSNYSWLSSITLPSSVMSIGGGAFSGCSELKEVRIGDIATWCEVEMPPYVYECAHKLYVDDEEVTSLIIPEGVTHIGRAFSNCSGITSVTISSSVTSVDYCAFSGCSALMSFFVSDNNSSFSSRSGLLCSKDGETLVSGVNGNVVIPDGVMNIEQGAFSDLSGLMSVTIPEGVTYINEDVFLECTGLKSVTIPSSVRIMGGAAFLGCSGLQEVHISDIAAWCEMDHRSMYSPLRYAQKLYVGDDEVKDLVIPEGVTYIYDYAFYGFSGLRSIKIPQSVKYVGFHTFADCSGLTSVILPSSITYGDYFNCYFGGYTFRGCGGLTSISIPKGERVICPYTFADCSGLTSVTIPESVEAIGSSAFEGCNRLTSIRIPKSVGEIDSSAFGGCSMLESVNVDAANVCYCSIDGALYNKDATELICCPGGARAVTIPSSVTSIGYDAFYGCGKLTTVYVKAGDAERVRKMMSGKGIDVSKLTFIEEVIGDVTALKEVFGEESSVVRNLTSEEELMKFNEFLGKCGITVANQISEKQKRYAYESFRMSAIMVEPQLCENEPKLKIHEFKQGEGGWSVSISLKAGGEEIAMAKKALEERIFVGNKLTEIASKPDIVASPSEDGSFLTFTIAPPEGHEAFIMVRL